MVFIDTIRKFHRHIFMILYPLIYNIIAFVIGLLIIGFHGERQISIRFILDMGFPILSDISNNHLLFSSVELLNLLQSGPKLPIIILVVMLLLGTFMQGGYIRYLYAIVNDQRYTSSMYFKFSLRNWPQFILLEVIVFLLQVAIASFLLMFFPNIGQFAALMFLVMIRVTFIYLEYTIVIDKLSIPDALKRSRKYMGKSFANSFLVVIVMYLVTMGMSYLLHTLWSPITIIIFIPLYVYIMTIIQLLFMTIYNSMVGKEL